ncbi:MAG: MMPL family transporter [Rhodobacteraceae bacterium]|nr:MMPL family transporter [Paracoccaceae bacterium]
MLRGLQTEFSDWIVAHRWVVILFAHLLVAAAAGGLLFLKSETDYRTFFSEDNPELLAFNALENTFEKSDNVLFLIAPDDRDATSEAALAAAAWLVERAWQTPYSTRVDSIVNFPHLSADGNSLSVADLADPETISDADERSRIREIALTDPRIVGNLVARDGSVSAVNVTVKLPDGNSEAATAEVALFARGTMAEAAERFPGIDFRLVGTVAINQVFTESTIATMGTVLPASLAVMALILAVLTRGLSGVAATGSVVILSVLAAMGVSGWVGIPFSTSTAATPIIVLTLATANCLHILVSAQQRIGEGVPRPRAVVDSLTVNLHPVFLASATTAIGFLTMNFSEVPPYRHLGNLVAIGTMVSFLLSVTLLPVLLTLLPIKGYTQRWNFLDMSALAELTIRHRTTLLWGSAAVVLALSIAVPRNEANDIVTRFFDESVQIRKDLDFVDERLSGNTVIEYSITSKAPGGITDPEFLKSLSAFSEWYRAQPETRHVLVISDTFKQINLSMHGDDPAELRLPDNGALASQYLLLYELSLPFGLDINNRIDVSKSATRMTVTTQTLSSRELLELVRRAEIWLEANGTSNFTRIDSSGASLMFAHIGARNFRAMLIGTSIAFLGVSILLIAALRSPRIGMVSLVPNFVPGLMAFGVWGMTVGEVGIALAVIMAMTIGIVVDDTVHFLSKYQEARKELGFGPEDAVRHAFQTVGRALFATTLILVAGFFVLAQSSFLPTSQMGQLTAMVIALALICDFLFLPPLLITLDRWQDRKA